MNARQPQPKTATAANSKSPDQLKSGVIHLPLKPTTPSRLDQLEALLAREEGATIDQLTAATGWQPHSVRGAMAGALKKRGVAITSDKPDGTRIYRAARGDK